jgi:hypothetical protein
MQLLEWPSVQHIEFDRLVEDVDEFEHLPAMRVDYTQDAFSEPDEPEDAPLNDLILAGLVSPV